MKTSSGTIIVLFLSLVLPGSEPGGPEALAGPRAAEAQAGEPIEMRFAGGIFRPEANGAGAAVPAAPEWLRTTAVAPIQTSARGRKYLVAVVRAPLSADERRLLESAGAQLLDYVPVRGYRVRLDPGAEAKIRGLPFVAWLGEPPRHLKIEPALLHRAAAPGGDTPLRVILASDETPGRTIE
ncbi:MAG TPA: hypothetical protein VKF61_10850, partial [Candidatus Polarisedimenticolia bacterium]|nr:hypothetical protein [Candidatus Polarisedimenticolia bacterium]